MRPGALFARTTVAALALGAMVLESGPAAAASGPACFWSRNILSARAANSTTVYLRVSGRDIYELKLFARCPDVSWSSRIQVRARGSSQICEGSGLNVEVVPTRRTGASSPAKCHVNGVRRLTPEEADALPASARP